MGSLDYSNVWDLGARVDPQAATGASIDTSCLTRLREHRGRFTASPA